MTQFINAIWGHTIKLLTFQHDGTGLPEKPSSFVRVATLAYFFTGCLYLWALPQASPGLLYGLMVLATIALNLFVRPAACVIIVLCSFVSHLGGAAGALLLDESNLNALQWVLLVWSLSAIIAGVGKNAWRVSQQTQEKVRK